jgi:hypothetical protein
VLLVFLLLLLLQFLHKKEGAMKLALDFITQQPLVHPVMLPFLIFHARRVEQLFRQEEVQDVTEKLVEESIWVKSVPWHTMPRLQVIVMTFKHFLLVVLFLD